MSRLTSTAEAEYILTATENNSSAAISKLNPINEAIICE